MPLEIRRHRVKTKGTIFINGVPLGGVRGVEVNFIFLDEVDPKEYRFSQAKDVTPGSPDRAADDFEAQLVAIGRVLTLTGEQVAILQDQILDMVDPADGMLKVEVPDADTV